MYRMLKRRHTFSLVGTLLSATVATFAVWYYNRKAQGAQKPPSETPEYDNFLTPTQTPRADNISPYSRTSHGRLPVSNDNIPTGSVVTSSNSLQAISGTTAGDSISTASAAVPSDTPLAVAVGTSNYIPQAISGTASSENISTASVLSPGDNPSMLTAGYPSDNYATIPTSSPIVGLEVPRRTSGRTKSSQQRLHATSVPSSRQPRAWLSEPLCVVEVVADVGPVQEVTIAIKQTTFNDAEDNYEACQSLLVNSESLLGVTATIDSGVDWSLGSLNRLNQALERLTNDDKQGLCKRLTVKLPRTSELSSNGGVTELVLPEVVSLNWESNAYQLPLIGLGNFTHLSNLEVRSRLSFRDCQLLLRCASQTLEFCHIERVIDNSNDTYAFPKETCTTIELAANDPTVMRRLSFLSIDSVLCPGEMLQKFRFRALKGLKLLVQYDFDPERNMNSIPWAGLEEISMTCHFVDGGAAWVDKSTPNANKKKIAIVRNPGV
ncbi:hypothetical protein C0993_005295 [Termitomyces sp. T159_Od127]|nr:hypothetical protein C0993_005295 [Termitomyces sp. T159_Od127]